MESRFENFDISICKPIPTLLDHSHDVQKEKGGEAESGMTSDELLPRVGRWRKKTRQRKTVRVTGSRNLLGTVSGDEEPLIEMVEGWGRVQSSLPPLPLDYTVSARS